MNLPFTTNNGERDATLSMSFYLLTYMDNLRGTNQTRYLIRPIIIIKAIIRVKNKTRK